MAPGSAVEAAADAYAGLAVLGRLGYCCSFLGAFAAVAGLGSAGFLLSSAGAASLEAGCSSEGFASPFGLRFLCLLGLGSSGSSLG